MKSRMKNLIILFLISSPLFGQNIDYNKIILPASSQALAFEEKLIQLAWQNHPTNEAVRREVNIARYDVKQSHTSWLDNIRLTGNMNEFNLNKQTDIEGRANLYPKSNIGASISLGAFFSTP